MPTNSTLSPGAMMSGTVWPRAAATSARVGFLADEPANLLLPLRLRGPRGYPLDRHLPHDALGRVGVEDVRDRDAAARAEPAGGFQAGERPRPRHQREETG